MEMDTFLSALSYTINYCDVACMESAADMF